MADLTAAGVTVLDSWPDSGVNSRRFVVKKVSLVLSSAGSGAASNKIPAAALGMATIDDVSSFVKSDGLVVVPATPNVAYNEILLGGGASNATASYTGTFIGIVRGQSASWN